jgi:hypothetical protein
MGTKANLMAAAVLLWIIMVKILMLYDCVVVS